MWHNCVHACAQLRYGLEHGWGQVGMGSVQALRGVERGVFVQGQVVMKDGENGQGAGVVEGG